MITAIYLLDLIGVAVFAASGALVASRKEMDLIGFGLLATLTGIGGGTLRDIILNRPVFWLEDPRYVAICLTVAALVFFVAAFVQRRWVPLLWLDAIGLAVFAVMGAHIASKTGAEPLVAIVLGLVTATFGGLARDVVAQEVPLILKQEIYATAALLAAAAYVVGLAIFPTPAWSAYVAVVIGFVIRAGAILQGWTLPRYRPRPGRPF